MSTPAITLYHYWRSSCSWRVRWVLLHKKIPCEKVHIHLLKQEQKSASYRAINPNGQVPTLLVDGKTLSESLAIIEWLEESFPEQPVLPKDPWLKAQAREIALIVAAGIQPMQNLKVLDRISSEPALREQWAQGFIRDGLAAIEQRIAKFSGPYCLGQELTLADIFLVPQVYGAKRFQVALNEFPRCEAIYEHCLKLPACEAASPEKQPEATL